MASKHLITVKKNLFNKHMKPVLLNYEHINAEQTTKILKVARQIADEYAAAAVEEATSDTPKSSVDELFEQYQNDIAEDIFDISKKIGVPMFDIIGVTRGKEEVATARNLVCLMLTNKYGTYDKMFKVIGKAMSGRDRSTIRSARNRGLSLLEVKDEMFMAMYNKLNEYE